MLQSLRVPGQAIGRALPCVLAQNGNGNGNWDVGGVRSKHSKRVNTRVQKLIPGGRDFDGFTYFPRKPEDQDPPIEPTKLLMVKRIRTVKKCPYWEKDAIASLGIGDRGETAVVKNTPAICAKLYRIKHLIEITPIQTPHGLPDNPEDGFLKENGDFVVTKSLLSGHEVDLTQAKKENEEIMKHAVDGSTLKNRLRLRWYSRYDII